MKNIFTESDREYIWSLYNKLQDSDFENRFYGEKINITNDRPEYSRDYARILYSSSFRRLQGKMQILGVETTAFFRNRLTHSLEVAQIAKSIARILSELCGVKDNKRMYQDKELCLLDAAALAHDIGHPAFGHKGERVLNSIAEKYKLRFEGNAQNYRVLNFLDRHGSSCEGLNLTYRTLLAINKYIVKEKKSVKKFMYSNDYDDLIIFRKEHNIEKERTLDVQIIELADDIAYVVHDLEDALSLNLSTLDEILFEIGQKSKKANELLKEKIKQADNDIRSTCGIRNVQEYSHLLKKRLTSLLTDNFIRNLAVVELNKEQCKKYGINNNSKELSMSDEYRTLCKCLKETIFTCAMRKSNIALYEAKGEIILNTLFDIYFNEKINKEYNLLPLDYKPTENDERIDIVRHILDYLAGMMDTYAISEYEKLTGITYDKINIATSHN